MLEHEETMRLIKLAQQGDEQAKTTLIEENTPLLKSLIRRYIGKSVEYDDLLQISSIGLLKAIYNFSLDYNVRFSTYAVPMILGEVKRFLRDDGYIKVSRSVKCLASKISRFVEQYRNEKQTEPTVEEIAKQFDIEPTEVVFTMDSTKMPVSLYEKVDSDNEKALTVMDKLITPNSKVDDEMTDRVILKSVIDKLSHREKKIIIMRYFRDMTQGEIAEELGVSQVQVSRLENGIIKRIKNDFSQE